MMYILKLGIELGIIYSPKLGEVIGDGAPRYLVTAKSGDKTFALEQWWSYKDDLGQQWVVPKGYIYDLASVPRWLWWLQWGAWNNAAVLHDFAYCFGHAYIEQDGQLHKQELSKQEADKLFADIIYTSAQQFNQKNADLCRINRMYLAVSWFGRGFWSKDPACQAKIKYGKSLEELQNAYDASETKYPEAIKTVSGIPKLVC